MNPKVRQAISDLLELSAIASGYRWVAVLSDHLSEPVIYPPEDQGQIGPYLTARKELLSRAADEPADFGTLLAATKLETTGSGTEGFQPGCFIAIGLFDSSGNRQGTLIALDNLPRELNENEKNAITRIARLAETHMKAGTVDGLNQRLETKRKQIDLLSQVASQITNGVVITDESGLITWVNHGFEKISGYSLEETLGKKPGSFLQGEQTDPKTVVYMHEQLARREEFTAELINYHKNGSPYWIRLQCQSLVYKGGARQGFIAIQTDITTEKAHQEKLEHTVRMNHAILDSTIDCVFMFDAQTLLFLYVNQGAINHLGYSRNELLTLHPFDIQPRYPESNFRVVVSPLLSGEISRLNFQTVHRHKDGHEIPVDFSLQYSSLEGDQPRFIAIARDISEQKQRQDEIEHLAYFDPLTDLPNRRLIREKLESSIQASSESGCFGAVMLSDLDDFKGVNDTLGHRHGDELLVEISGRFKEVLGEAMPLARLGGDEFLVVLNTPHQDRNSAIAQVTDTARQLLAAAGEPTETLGNARQVSTSIGVVLYNDLSTSASDLTRMADIAMYDAKRKGKNSFSIFDDAMQQKLLDEHSLTFDLNVALARDNEVAPWFQPKVNQKGQFTGFEALVRWNHPERGLLNPGDFIGLAERNNLIVPLSDHVLSHACRQMSIWRQQFSIDHWTVSVNISQSQLAMRDFPQKVEKVLAETGLPARALVLEITETVVAENILHSIRQMELVRSMGIKFSMDDFGTGYSSLSYLRQLPIEELKIDRSFVESLLLDEEGYSIVSAILSLTHSLKLSVIAEGIEEQEQWQILKKLGCEGFQGFLFSRPQPAEALSQELERQGLTTLNSKHPHSC